MNKSAFWTKDWFLGLIIVIAFAGLAATGITQGIERWAYDWGLRGTSADANQEVVVLAIDEKSLETVGRWPWSRHIHADAINKLTEAGAKVIGHTAFFFEPQEDPGLAIIRDLEEYLTSTGLASTQFDEEMGGEMSLPGEEFDRLIEKAAALGAETLIEDIDFVGAAVLGIQDKVSEAKMLLDGDLALSESILAADNVVMPMFMFLGENFGNPENETPAHIKALGIEGIANNSDLAPLTAYSMQFPIDKVATVTQGLGHLNAVLDVDGAARTEALLVDYYGEYYPSMSLMLAAKSLNLDIADIVVTDKPPLVQVGGLKIKTDNELKMHTFFYAAEGGVSAFTIDSFSDFYFGVIPAEKYAGKTVLIGPTAAGLGTTLVTPINSSMPPVLTLAHSVSSILEEDFFIQPSWAVWVQLGVFVFVALFLTALLPRLNAQNGALVSLGIFALGIAAHYVVMTLQTMWIPLMTPMIMLIIGYILLTTKRFLITEKGKEHADQESAESNRMLGLAFQGQGQLDMAFDKFRKCPKDEALAESLFNLALDYERKRQFAKSANVYQYIYDFAPKFKDVADRLDRSKKMEETIIIGPGGAGSLGPSLVSGDDSVEKPKLGRYEIIKELGKGAMGMVYLGNDPKISREVAIKTMALSQEFEGDELEDVKSRFFREAETAGRLNHPNIVVMLDAGEEHDLAFIAMEFLKGKDLAENVKPHTLLAPPLVFDIILKCANALDYAHGFNVVHRDIKPANIMYEPESKEVKITDFGIARITDANKTKTGTILGTPSYMSPEQLQGKKVDGRSDLFSLTVMAFQMLTGVLPFQGDSMATLMFQIANEPHPKMREFNPKLPPELDKFIDKGLAKDPDKRFATGKELANGLKVALAAAKKRREAKAG